MDNDPKILIFKLSPTPDYFYFYKNQIPELPGMQEVLWHQYEFPDSAPMMSSVVLLAKVRG